jgi:hypothetical protein
VTSPPYWGLRDYGHADQIGQEATPELFVQTMVEVFREVRRVLKADGTCWLNLGDTYANTNRGHNSNGLGKLNGSNLKNKAQYEPNRNTPLPPGLKAKDLIGIPWRVAFALQAQPDAGKCHRPMHEKPRIHLPTLEVGAVSVEP